MADDGQRPAPGMAQQPLRQAGHKGVGCDGLRTLESLCRKIIQPRRARATVSKKESQQSGNVEKEEK